MWQGIDGEMIRQCSLPLSLQLFVCEESGYKAALWGGEGRHYSMEKLTSQRRQGQSGHPEPIVTVNFE